MNRRTLVLTAVVAVGCATGRQLVAPRSQYRLYRETQLAPTLEARLGAANRYLHVAPKGVYAPELRAWFEPAERAYLARAHDQLPLLLAYRKALPDGPSIAAVRDRIEELESAERFAKNRASAHAERVATLEMNLERASAQRKAFITELTTALGALASVRAYGRPLAALPPDLLTRFGISDPSAGCPTNVCSQTLTPRFAIPNAATELAPREAAYTLELTLASGVLASLRLQGRELFSRIGEAFDLRPVSFADPLSRAEAIGRALPLLENALGTALAAPGCEQPAVSPVVLERNCDGVHVTVTAAVDSGEDDVIAFGAEMKATPPKAAPKRPKP